MSTFTLYNGQTAVVAWDCDTGAQSLLSAAFCRNDLVVLDETSFTSFELSDPLLDTDYGIQIGELWISEFLPEGISPDGVRIGGLHSWAEHVYFESARGLTQIRLYARARSDDRFNLILDGTVFVLPSKVGEEAYQMMSTELARLSKGLLSDLYGKSRRTFDLRHSKALKNLHSKEEELQAIRAACPKLTRLLTAISCRPSFKIEKIQRNIRYTGQYPLSARTLARLSQRALQPADVAAGQRIPNWVREESLDIPEHRFLKAFLMLLRSRARACALAARRHIEAIEGDRPYRDVSLTGNPAKPTLYQTQDLPMIARLESAVQDAATVVATIESMLRLPLLSGVQSEFVSVRGGMFGRSADYKELEAFMLRYLRRHFHWVEGDSFNNIGKLTSTMYEQWCYLRIVDAFRTAGVQLDDWNGSIDESAQTRFTIDFSRGLRFEGEMTPSLKLRISYQPWIHNLETARRLLSPLYRGGTAAVSWSPDVVLEVCQLKDGTWVPVYGVVLDSKYSRRLRDSQWASTGKYLEIRAAHNRRQVCKQLWLMAPLQGGIAIRCEDPEVSFGIAGPDIHEDETVRFTLSARPTSEILEHPFSLLATGLLEFFKSRFSNP